MQTWIPVVVAVVSAIAAVWSAVHARRSARRIASLSHGVQGLDRNIEQLRLDYREFIHAFGGVRELTDVGTLLAAGAVLRANPACTDDMDHHVREIVGRMSEAITTPTKRASAMQGLDVAIDKTLADFRQATAELNAQRQNLLAAS